MTSLLYAVTERGAGTDPGTGLQDQPLRLLTHENLCAVLSDHPAPPPAEVDNLWAYEAVVERLMESGPLLPARFGTTAQDDSEIAAMLRERHSELSATIDRVRGAVELAIRPAAAEGGDPETGTVGTSGAQTGKAQTGTEYMQARLHQERQLAALEGAAANLIRDRARRGPAARAYLVDRQDVAEFVAVANELGLTITGPWPPYSFVEGQSS